MTKEEKSNVKSSEQTKSRGSRDRHQKKDKPKPLTKVIIRRLPPTMTEEEFLKQIDPLPDNDFYYFAAADWSLGFDATCRAYINFRNHEDVFLFRDRFDGYVFVDTKGEEYPAVVEFAPFQGLPKNKARKTDPKVNTIESEQHYNSFLQKLEEDREACKTEGRLEFALPTKDDKKTATTPLLQFLMNKKMDRREEQKKRTEDNRRKRDEDKQKRRNRVSKGIPSAIKEEGAPAKDAKTRAEGTADNPEEKKNSRAKRRAERDQRRREEHEQRRREKEKERAAENEQKILQTQSQQSAKDPEKTLTIAKPPEGENKRKEVKKYSERRERNRPRNSDHSTATAADSGPKKSAANSAAVPAADKKPQSKEDNPMINFMKNLSNVKEFVPKHMQDATHATDTAVVDMEEVKEKLENISLQEMDQNNLSPEKEDEVAESGNRSQRNSSSSGGYTNEAKSQDRIDRRIRNKDRPSIAIYQPGRARLRSSEEGQQNAEPTKSSPTSDTESLKKEERPNTTRKVSRYSERRPGRGRDGKRRNSREDKAGKSTENNKNETDGGKDEKIEKRIDGQEEEVENEETE